MPRRRLVEDCLVLDVLALHGRGVFDAPGAWVLTFHRGQELLARVALVVLEGCRLAVAYNVTGEDGTSEKVVFTVELERTPCFFGGERVWFRCPGPQCSDGCDRRCGRVYLPSGEVRFACRACYGLAYRGVQQRGNPLWDRFLKPMRNLDKAARVLRRVRSPVKKEAALRKLQCAEEEVRKFEDWGVSCVEKMASGERLPKKEHEMLTRYMETDLTTQVELEIQRADEWRREWSDEEDACAVGDAHGDRRSA